MNDTVVSTNAARAASAYAERSDTVQAFILHHLADTSVVRLPYVEIKLPSLISLHGVMVLLGGLLLVLMALALRRRIPAVPSGAANLVEFFVVFVRDQIACRYFGEEDGRRMTPLLCSFFVFILTLNLIGLVPGLYTATANVSVTGALAAITLFFMIFGAMFRHGPLGFVKGFIPHGVPWPVLIVLVPIEFIGLFAKSFALTIRLFANELAGHMVLFFMLGLVVIFGAWGLPAVLMGLVIFFLEVFVAFLQAYIFTLLSAVFISQRFQPEH